MDTAAARRERAAVAEAQEALNRLGYDAGPVDGAPGPRTRNAIAQFRADYGLGPGTKVDPELVGALRVAARNAPAETGGSMPSTTFRAGNADPRAPQAVSPPLWSEPEQGPAASTATMEGGMMVIDGRVAAAANGKFDFLGETIDYMAMTADLEVWPSGTRWPLRPAPWTTRKRPCRPSASWNPRSPLRSSRRRWGDR